MSEINPVLQPVSQQEFEDSMRDHRADERPADATGIIEEASKGCKCVPKTVGGRVCWDTANCPKHGDKQTTPDRLQEAEKLLMAVYRSFFKLYSFIPDRAITAYLTRVGRIDENGHEVKKLT